jgi:hypothetical protein
LRSSGHYETVPSDYAVPALYYGLIEAKAKQVWARTCSQLQQLVPDSEVRLSWDPPIYRWSGLSLSVVRRPLTSRGLRGAQLGFDVIRTLRHFGHWFSTPNPARDNTQWCLQSRQSAM